MSDTVLNKERFELVLREINRIFMLTDVVDIEYNDPKSARIKKLIKRVVDWPGCAGALQDIANSQHDDTTDAERVRLRDPYFILSLVLNGLRSQIFSLMRRCRNTDPNHCQTEIDDNLRILHRVVGFASESVQERLASDLKDFETLMLVCESTLLQNLQEFEKAVEKYERAVLRGGRGLEDGGGVNSLHQTIMLIQTFGGVELGAEYNAVIDTYAHGWIDKEMALVERAQVTMGRALVGLQVLAENLTSATEGRVPDGDEPLGMDMWIANFHWRLKRMAHWTAMNTLDQLERDLAKDDFKAFSGGMSVLIEYFLSTNKKLALTLAEIVIELHACGPKCWDLALAYAVVHTDAMVDDVGSIYDIIDTAQCQCEAKDAEEWAVSKEVWSGVAEKLSETLKAMRPRQPYAYITA